GGGAMRERGSPKQSGTSSVWLSALRPLGWKSLVNQQRTEPTGTLLLVNYAKGPHWDPVALVDQALVGTHRHLAAGEPAFADPSQSFRPGQPAFRDARSRSDAG